MPRRTTLFPLTVPTAVSCTSAHAIDDPYTRLLRPRSPTGRGRPLKRVPVWVRTPPGAPSVMPPVFRRRRTSTRPGSAITTVRLMTTVTTRSVEYPADGLTMVGHLALPAGVDKRPAVLIGPEGPGIDDVQRRRADALAELGYVALAFDIHGGRWFTDPEEMLARCMPLLADPDRMRGIGHAALDVLRAEPRIDPDRIAAIGYGTGGAIALELGRDGV